ncbi:thioredoxin family protein [Flavobacterium sp. W22_SRS_FP1]|uniref:thioredoxin family protein n=1 Tax=Flavobacterium sp. W22_SRS_FP1 TaxID=3240276 RepID=UPI003F915D53
MKTTVAKALFNSHSYTEYRKMVSDLLRDERSTGNEQSAKLTNCSGLNQTRMNLLEKTIKIPEGIIQSLRSLKNEYIWLVITEGWSRDAAQALPVFNEMARESKGKVDVKIVLRNENEELMRLFLTNKKRSIPKLIVINRETGGMLAHWGPRPKGASDLINDYIKEHGSIDEAVEMQLEVWYLHDKGQSIQNEIIGMMLDLDQ